MKHSSVSLSSLILSFSSTLPMLSDPVKGFIIPPTAAIHGKYVYRVIGFVEGSDAASRILHISPRHAPKHDLALHLPDTTYPPPDPANIPALLNANPLHASLVA